MTTASNKQTGPMGSGEKAAVVGRAYAAFNAADIDTLTQVFDENSSWHTPGRGSIASDRKGRDAVFAQFGRYGGETAGTFQANLLHLLQGDDGSVVGVHRNTAERNGGRITAGREHFYDLYAWNEFWA